ncbi:DUF4352 domain-containing protein [Halorientalis salina]|uniref:DUF4352 domain-containing protein n=1 Tax=Halorientalis salina TaxID=2932266 RepID=UPI0010ACB494|nr:DUF4352 domain-containing protein [Halorientalis salina]
MKRRALLTSMGVGMAGMAGCLNGNSNSGGNTPQENAGTPVAVSTPDGKKASFETAINLSQEEVAQVGTEYEFEITVKNTGGQPGVYRAPVKTRTGSDVEYEEQSTAMVYVEAGESKTAAITVPPFESVGSADVRFGGPKNTWSVEIIGPDLAMGESFEVDGFEITVESVEFQDTFTYTVSGYENEDTPSISNGKFAVVTIKLESIGSSSWMADSHDYKMLIDGSERTAWTDARYNKRSLAAGQTKRVQLPYEVAGGTAKSDLIFKYEGVREDKYARWSPGFSATTSGDGS